MKKILLFLMLLFPLSVWAAPSLTSATVTGTIADGESIVISNGTGFGATGPTVVLFDDFEGGVNGASLSTGNGSAKVGTWSSNASRTLPTYSNANARGTLSMRGNTSTPTTADGDYAQIASNFTDASNYLVSYWFILPSGEEWPHNPDTNFKFTWLYDANSSWPTYDYTIPVTIESTVSSLFIGCDDPGAGPGWRYGYGYDGDWNTTFTIGTWRRFTAYVKRGTVDGIVKMYETYASGGPSTGTGLSIYNVTDSNNRYTGDAGEVINRITIPGYTRNHASHPTYDDFYIATGTGAEARVEIGNNATYTSCTNLAVCTPTAWADTSITATVRAGSFTTGTAYLFVTDSSGVTSAGKEITLGASTPTPPTSVPTIGVGGFRTW